MEIQGTAADLIKLAMLNVHRRLEGGEAAGEDAVERPRRTGVRGPAGGGAGAGEAGPGGDDRGDDAGRAAEGGRGGGPNWLEVEEVDVAGAPCGIAARAELACSARLAEDERQGRDGSRCDVCDLHWDRSPATMR